MIIAITSSKGGAGKTTLTALAACGMFHTTDKKIIVVDIDPQGSMETKRKRDFELAKQAGESTIIYKTMMKNMEVNGKPFFDVTSMNLLSPWEDIRDTIKALNKTNDIVFIDFPGSLNLHDNCLRILTILDFIFVPIYVDENSRDSAFTFTKALVNLKRKNKIKAEFKLFFNKFHDVGGKNGVEFQELKEYLQKTNIPLMENPVYEDVQIERYSTIKPPRFSIAKKNIYNWINEIYNIIYKK